MFLSIRKKMVHRCIGTLYKAEFLSGIQPKGLVAYTKYIGVSFILTELLKYCVLLKKEKIIYALGHRLNANIDIDSEALG